MLLRFRLPAQHRLVGRQPCSHRLLMPAVKNTAKNRRRRRYRAIRKQKQRDVIDKEKQLDFVRHIRRNNKRRGQSRAQFNL